MRWYNHGFLEEAISRRLLHSVVWISYRKESMLIRTMIDLSIFVGTVVTEK